MNRLFWSFGEENVGEFTIANVSYFSESRIWLGKILANDILFAKFVKVSPARVLCYMVSLLSGIHQSCPNFSFDPPMQSDTYLNIHCSYVHLQGVHYIYMYIHIRIWLYLMQTFHLSHSPQVLLRK